MNKKYKKYLYYAPRILAVLFIFFISLFALDVFAEDYTFLETIIALFMHLIPTYFLIIALIIAWKWELIGGILFILLSLTSIIFFNYDTHPASLLIIALPVFLIGILFLLNRYLNS